MLSMGYRLNAYLTCISLFIFVHSTPLFLSPFSFSTIGLLYEGWKKKGAEDRAPEYAAEGEIGVGEVINASGRKQELDCKFSLLSICAVGIRIDKTWAALGGSIVSLIEFLRRINMSLISK